MKGRRLRPEEVETELATLETLDFQALQERWLAVYGKPPPPRMRATFLRRAVAYRIQELAFGGLKPEIRRALRRIYLEDLARRKGEAEGTTQVPPRRHLLPGSTLMREWQGRMQTVEVSASGFQWNGASYRTLSAVAVAITGTKWSGPKFFGLTAPEEPTRPVRSSSRRAGGRSP